MPTVNDPIVATQAFSTDYDFGNPLTGSFSTFLTHSFAANTRHPGVRFLVPSDIDGSAITDAEIRFYFDLIGATPNGYYMSERTGASVAFANNSTNAPYFRFLNATSGSSVAFSMGAQTASNWGPDNIGTGDENGWFTLDSSVVDDIKYAISNNPDHGSSGTYVSVLYLLTPEGGATQNRFHGHTNTNPPELRLTTDIAAIDIDGESVSSGTAKGKETFNLITWNGLDATQAGSQSGAYYPAVTLGRGDIGFENMTGQNPLANLWDSPADRNEILANKLNILNTPSTIKNSRGSFGQYAALRMRNEITGNGSYMVHNPYYWNPDKTTIVPSSGDYLDTWSVRFYLNDWNSVDQNHRIFWSRIGGVDAVQIVSRGSNFGIAGDIIVQWDAATGNSGWAGSGKTTSIAGGEWDRVEIQASIYADPKLMIRFYREDSTTPFHTVTANPASPIVDEFRFGFYDPGLGTVDSSYYTNIEIWDDYDLNGQFEQSPSITDAGAPFVERDWEWYEYDGTNVSQLEHVGVVRTNNAGSITFTTEPTPDDQLDWHSNMTGSAGASVSAGSSNDFTTVTVTAGSIVYEDTLVPPGVSKSIKHDTQGSPAYVSASVSASEYIFVSEDFYFDDLPSTQGIISSEEQAILKLKDSSGDTIWSLRVSETDEIMSIDGEESNIEGNEFDLIVASADTWYRVEVLYDANAKAADGRDQILGRLYADYQTEPVAFWTETATNSSPISEIVFGPEVCYSSNGGSEYPFGDFVVYTARHAFDSTDWVGGASVGYEPDFVFGSMEGSIGSYRDGLSYQPLEFGASPSYSETDIRYGIGSGDTARRNLDVHIPPGDRPENGWPALIYVHGGSWAGGSSESITQELFQTCMMNGYAVISINYQLASDDAIFNLGSVPSYTLTGVDAGRFPTFVLDTKQAFHWVKNNAGASPYYIDTDRVGAFAYSAGTFNVMAAVATRDVTDDGASVRYDWTLAGNASVASADGNTYYYNDEGQGDPDVVKAIYLHAPILNLKKAVDWEENEGPGSSVYVYNSAHGLMWNTVYNAYADSAGWDEDIIYNNINNWASITPSNFVPTGINFGSIDMFVISDPFERFPNHSQYRAVNDAWNDASISVELDTYIGSMHHDRVEEEFNYEHFWQFIRRHI